MSSSIRSALSDVESANVRRLVHSLQDVGIQAILTLEAIDTIKGADSEMVAKLVGYAVEDVASSTCDDFSDCAPSLTIVVTLAEQSGLFPEDFLISEESLEQCASAFFAKIRDEVE